MDYKAIEAALVLIKDRADKYAASETGTALERMCGGMWESACERLAVDHTDDLLRLVRAMAWMEANNPELYYSDEAQFWICDGLIGESPLDAIEAAIQQTKGASDEA